MIRLVGQGNTPLIRGKSVEITVRGYKLKVKNEKAQIRIEATKDNVKWVLTQLKEDLVSNPSQAEKMSDADGPRGKVDVSEPWNILNDEEQHKCHALLVTAQPK